MSNAMSAKERMAAKRIRDATGTIRTPGIDVSPNVFRMLAEIYPSLNDVVDDRLKYEVACKIKDFIDQHADEFFK